MSETDDRVDDLTFPSGMPRVVYDYREEDDIMYVKGRDGTEHIVWSDRRLKVYSRYDTHSSWSEWREKAYWGDPRPPQVKEYWDYHPTVDAAMDDALLHQERIRRESGEEVPIYFRER